MVGLIASWWRVRAATWWPAAKASETMRRPVGPVNPKTARLDLGVSGCGGGVMAGSVVSAARAAVDAGREGDEYHEHPGRPGEAGEDVTGGGSAEDERPLGVDERSDRLVGAEGL